MLRDLSSCPKSASNLGLSLPLSEFIFPSAKQDVWLPQLSTLGRIIVNDINDQFFACRTFTCVMFQGTPGWKHKAQPLVGDCVNHDYCQLLLSMYQCLALGQVPSLYSLFLSRTLRTYFYDPCFKAEKTEAQRL